MVKPQQPELRRTGYGDTDRDGKELRTDLSARETSGNAGPVPEENQPGHRPEHEQDKPTD